MFDGVRRSACCVAYNGGYRHIARAVFTTWWTFEDYEGVHQGTSREAAVNVTTCLLKLCAFMGGVSKDDSEQALSRLRYIKEVTRLSVFTPLCARTGEAAVSTRIVPSVTDLCTLTWAADKFSSRTIPELTGTTCIIV